VFLSSIYIVEKRVGKSTFKIRSFCLLGKIQAFS
jgi:hypothetical protein